VGDETVLLAVVQFPSEEDKAVEEAS